MSAPLPAPANVSRTSAALLAVLLLLHLGLAALALRRASAALPIDPIGLRSLASLVLTCFGLVGIALLRWPRYGARIFAVAGLSAGIALMNPGPVLAVALMLLNAFVIGETLLSRATARAVPVADAGPTLPTISVLIGVSVWIGIIALTAPLRVHTSLIYGIALVLPLALGWRRVTGLAAQVRVALAPRSAPASERFWLVMVITLTLLHLVIVAKPDVGYDAATVHLRLPLLMAQEHRWIPDVRRYAWAVMPLGADYSYATAYLLGGETAVRIINLCYGIVALRIAYILVRRYADAVVALACIAMLASAPLAFLETGTLYIENLWLAYLLAATLAAVRLYESPSPRDALACAFLCAGAMQTKAIAVVWLAPMLLMLACAWVRRRSMPRVKAMDLALMAIAVLLATWPYLNAWARTGNPLFPFMNAVFRSPLFDMQHSFVNELYIAPLGPLSLYDVLSRSGRYIEGLDGAAGFHLFILLAVVIWAFTRKRTLLQWCCLGLALFFFAVVFSQQAYLRYLLPALVSIAVIGGWGIGDLRPGRVSRVAILAIAAIVCVINLRFMAAASGQNASLCLACSYDAEARRDYLATYAPERLVGRYLNAALPNARVGFFIVNGSGASDYVGYSRAANWHDLATYGPLLQAQSSDDVAAIARSHSLTHLVVPAAEPRCGPALDEQRLINEFRDRYTHEVWRLDCLSVAAIGPAASH